MSSSKYVYFIYNDNVELPEISNEDDENDNEINMIDNNNLGHDVLQTETLPLRPISASGSGGSTGQVVEANNNNNNNNINANELSIL